MVQEGSEVVNSASSRLLWITFQMKVKKTIRIRKENIRELKKLECVESIEQNGRDILVHLNPEYTEGKQEAVRDEYLVQWGSGKWQRFGEAAFNHLYKNPAKEAGAAWDE